MIPPSHLQPEDVRFLHDTAIGVAIPAATLVIHASMKLLAHWLRWRRHAPWRERLRRGLLRESGVALMRLRFDTPGDRFAFDENEGRVQLRAGAPMELATRRDEKAGPLFDPEGRRTDRVQLEPGPRGWTWVLGFVPIATQAHMAGDPFRSAEPERVDFEPFAGRYLLFDDVPESEPTHWKAAVVQYVFLGALTLLGLGCMLADPAPHTTGAVLAVTWLFLVPLAVLITLAAEPLRRL